MLNVEEAEVADEESRPELRRRRRNDVAEPETREY